VHWLAFRNNSNEFSRTDVAVDGGIRRILELRSATGETELYIDVSEYARIGKEADPQIWQEVVVKCRREADEP